MYKILTIGTLTLLFALSIKVQAIPAFARKYQLSCQTCHNPAPRLKAFGEEFAGNGFKLADQTAPRYFIPTGDPTLSLIRDLPFALRMDGFMKVDDDTDQKFDFSAPYLVKIMSGGELANNISYYFYFFFDERGHVAGIEDAFLMFNNVFGANLDINIGQFQVSDPLFKRELRLTLSDYEVYKTTPGISSANLEYDKGIMISYGLATGTDIVLQVVNGNGIGGVDDKLFYDRDKYKNIAARITQDVGEHFRIGLFGYFGKEFMKNNSPLNKISYWGPDLTISMSEKLIFNAQYLFRNDSGLFEYISDASGRKNVKTQGGFAEIIYLPKGDESKWYCVGLVNYVKSDFSYLNRQSASVHLGYLLRRNIRAVGEYTFFENTAGKQGNRFSIGFSTMF